MSACRLIILNKQTYKEKEEWEQNNTVKSLIQLAQCCLICQELPGISDARFYVFILFICSFSIFPRLIRVIEQMNTKASYLQESCTIVEIWAFWSGKIGMGKHDRRGEILTFKTINY